MKMAGNRAFELEETRAPSAEPGLRAEPPRAPVVGRQRLTIEEIAYQELLRYEPLYDREGLPLRFEADKDADWEYLDYRFYVARAGAGPAGFTGMALTRRTPGKAPSSVYFRSSYTLDQYRGMGVWKALWSFKLAEVIRLGWAKPDTAFWVLTRAEDLRYRRRGFGVESTVEHRYKGQWERFHIWTARWSRVLQHPANQPRSQGHVLLHL